MDNLEIVALPKDKWKGTTIPLVTRSDSYYDFDIEPLDDKGCSIRLVKKKSEKEIIHTPEEYDFPDSLYHMDKAKEVAVAQNRRAIILETQSCNTNAIGFYLHQGFEIIGFDTCCYTNNDIGRHEVRINLGFFFHREARRN